MTRINRRLVTVAGLFLVALVVLSIVLPSLTGVEGVSVSRRGRRHHHHHHRWHWRPHRHHHVHRAPAPAPVVHYNGNFRSARGGEGGSAYPACPGSQTISVSDAAYGTPSGSFNANGHIHASWCHRSAHGVAAAHCNGRNSCAVPGNNGVYGDPCRGTYKAILVVYTCNSPPPPPPPAPARIAAPVVHHHRAAAPSSGFKSARAGEGGAAAPSCPAGQTIRVADAAYGTPSGAYNGQGAITPSWCHRSAAAFAAGRCNGQASCSVPGNNGIFGDPCGGTYKAILVIYTCNGAAPARIAAPAAFNGNFKSARAGEGGAAAPSCPAGQTIRVADAAYGTPSGAYNGQGVITPSWCHRSAAAFAAGRCNGQASCSVPGNNGIFGDPCGGTYKAILVIYTCNGAAPAAPAITHAAAPAPVHHQDHAAAPAPIARAAAAVTSAHAAVTQAAAALQPARAAFAAGQQRAAAVVTAPAAPAPPVIRRQWVAPKAHEPFRAPPMTQQNYEGILWAKAKLGETARLLCPTGQKISVLDASFGAGQGVWASNGFINKGSCHLASSLTNAATLCNNQRVCALQPSIVSFDSDPCPKITTDKQVVATYQCLTTPAPKAAAVVQPTRVQTPYDGIIMTLIEDGKDAVLSCPAGKQIAVLDASYGSQQRLYASNGHITRGTCDAENSPTVVSGACQGKSTCTVKADGKVFTTSGCAAEARQLKITHRCTAVPVKFAKATPPPPRKFELKAVTAVQGPNGDNVLNIDGTEVHIHVTQLAAPEPNGEALTHVEEKLDTMHSEAMNSIESILNDIETHRKASKPCLKKLQKTIGNFKEAFMTEAQKIEKISHKYSYADDAPTLV